MKKLLLLAILPFMISCQDKTDELTDIEKLKFEHFSPEEFYKKNKIFNFTNVSIESLIAYRNQRDTLAGSFEFSDFDLASSDTKFYENYAYYSQAKQDFDHITEEDIKEERIFGVNPVKEIAYFKNIKFNYANFIIDKRSNKIVGCLFNTRNHPETNYYKQNIDLIRSEIGKPKYTYRVFTNDNGGGPVHYPLIYDVWFINGKMLQFNQNFEDGSDEDFYSISLLVLDENLIDTFDSSFNVQFTILKDFFDEGRQTRHNTESELNERIEKKDLAKALEKAKTLYK